jgi:hypothetical protein
MLQLGRKGALNETKEGEVILQLSKPSFGGKQSVLNAVARAHFAGTGVDLFSEKGGRLTRFLEAYLNSLGFAFRASNRGCCGSQDKNQALLIRPLVAQRRAKIR